MKFSTTLAPRWWGLRLPGGQCGPSGRRAVPPAPGRSRSGSGTTPRVRVAAPARRDGVQATRVPGRALEQAQDGEARAAEESVHLQRLDGVGAAARVETAVGEEQGRDEASVDTEERDHEARGRAGARLRHPGVPISTSSTPVGFPWNHAAASPRRALRGPASGPLDHGARDGPGGRTSSGRDRAIVALIGRSYPLPPATGAERLGGDRTRRRTPSRRSAASRSAPSSAEVDPAAAGWARTTRAVPSGRSPEPGTDEVSEAPGHPVSFHRSADGAPDDEPGP